MQRLVTVQHPTELRSLAPLCPTPETDRRASPHLNSTPRPRVIRLLPRLAVPSGGTLWQHTTALLVHARLEPRRKPSLPARCRHINTRQPPSLPSTPHQYRQTVRLSLFPSDAPFQRWPIHCCHRYRPAKDSHLTALFGTWCQKHAQQGCQYVVPWFFLLVLLPLPLILPTTRARGSPPTQLSDDDDGKASDDERQTEREYPY